MINQELEDQRNNKHPMYFINIVDCILRYYKLHPQVESGDEWKNKSGLFFQQNLLSFVFPIGRIAQTAILFSTFDGLYFYISNPTISAFFLSGYVIRIVPKIETVYTFVIQPETDVVRMVYTLSRSAVQRESPRK